MNLFEYVSIDELAKYWDLFSSYVDITTVFLWGILGGLLGFVLALILEIVLRNKILVRRKYKVLKFISYCYFAFFPFFFGFCFTQWFALHAIEKQVVKHIPSVTEASNALFDDYLRAYVKEQISAGNINIQIDGGVDAGVDLVVALASYMKQEEDSVPAKGIVSILSNLLKSDILKKEAKDQIAKGLSSSLGVDKEIIEELLETDLQKILDKGTINTFVELQVRSAFDGLRNQVLLVFIIGIGIPIIEILLAHYLNRKRRE